MKHFRSERKQSKHWENNSRYRHHKDLNYYEHFYFTAWHHIHNHFHQHVITYSRISTPLIIHTSINPSIQGEFGFNSTTTWKNVSLPYSSRLNWIRRIAVRHSVRTYYDCINNYTNPGLSFADVCLLRRINSLCFSARHIFSSPSPYVRFATLTS